MKGEAWLSRFGLPISARDINLGDNVIPVLNFKIQTLDVCQTNFT